MQIHGLLNIREHGELYNIASQYHGGVTMLKTLPETDLIYATATQRYKPCDVKHIKIVSWNIRGLGDTVIKVIVFLFKKKLWYNWLTGNVFKK